MCEIERLRAPPADAKFVFASERLRIQLLMMLCCHCVHMQCGALFYERLIAKRGEGDQAEYLAKWIGHPIASACLSHS